MGNSARCAGQTAVFGSWAGRLTFSAFDLMILHFSMILTMMMMMGPDRATAHFVTMSHAGPASVVVAVAAAEVCYGLDQVLNSPKRYFEQVELRTSLKITL